MNRQKHISKRGKRLYATNLFVEELFITILGEPGRLDPVRMWSGSGHSVDRGQTTAARRCPRPGSHCGRRALGPINGYRSCCETSLKRMQKLFELGELRKIGSFFQVFRAGKLCGLRTFLDSR